MATLVIVRHGQASAFAGGDYDQLSPLGGRQAEALGRWLVLRRHAFTRVFVGPRRRHLQTYEAVAEAYRGAGLPLPSPLRLEELDETDGPLALARSLPAMAERIPEVREAMAAMGPSASPQDWLRVLQRLVRIWSRGELAAAELPSWQAFRSTVQGAVVQMTEALPKGERAIAFTSAGTTAAAVSGVLELGDERAVDLMFSVRNASLTAIRVARDRLLLSSFNEVPHLEDEALHTFV